MAHHKERAKHKNANMREKSREYAHHEGMIDDRMVKEDHQEGIKRVIQRPGAMEVGQHGKMMKEGHANWKRTDKRTPRAG